MLQRNDDANTRDLRRQLRFLMPPNLWLGRNNLVDKPERAPVKQLRRVRHPHLNGASEIMPCIGLRQIPDILRKGRKRRHRQEEEKNRNAL